MTIEEKYEKLDSMARSLTCKIENYLQYNAGREIYYEVSDMTDNFIIEINKLKRE